MSNTVRVGFFDTWQPGYGQAIVKVLIANTTTSAEIFTDEACTQSAGNPQTLLQMTICGISYGRWQQPLYTNTPFQLQINTVDQTGVIVPPLTSLVDQDASAATVIPTGASQAGALADILGRQVNVLDYGIFLPVGSANASAITNNASLTAAIDAVSAQGGGYVDTPAGTYQFTTIASLPANVVIRGQGRLATTLQSTATGKVLTISGSHAGLQGLTLDGISQVTGSIGAFAANVDFIVMADVQIQRFATGLQRFGGTGSHWRDLFISDCLTGYDAEGNSDNGNGGALFNEFWDGGKIELNANVGLSLKYIDSPISGLTFRNIGFDTNTQTAISVFGANSIKLVDCWGLGNGSNFNLNDAAPAVEYNSAADTLGNLLDGFEVIGGRWGPAISPAPASGSNTAIAAVNSINTFTGNLARVAFRHCDFSYQTNNIFAPGNNILVQDCNELFGMNFGGDTPTAWTRNFSVNSNEGAAVTSGATTGAIWQITPIPGQNIVATARIVGRGRNSGHFFYAYIGCFVRPLGDIINYDNCASQFTPGAILTGATSRATARIFGIDTPTGSLTLSNVSGTFQVGETLHDQTTGSSATIVTAAGGAITYNSGSGFFIGDAVKGGTSNATGKIVTSVNTGPVGSLDLQDITGDFLNGEALSDSNGGSANANGGLINPGSAVFETFSLASAGSNPAFGAAFVNVVEQLQLQVTGDTGLTMEWCAHVDLVTSVDVSASNLPNAPL